MIDSIAGAFNGLKGAMEITQGFLSLKTDAAVSAKAVELNRIIGDVQFQLFAAQSDYAAVSSRVRELESEVMDLKNWSLEKERYQLHELPSGTLVYRIKPEKQNGEPVHDICPNCYQNGVKSILQNAGAQKSHNALSCPRCATVFLSERIPCLIGVL